MMVICNRAEGCYNFKCLHHGAHYVKRGCGVRDCKRLMYKTWDGKGGKSKRAHGVACLTVQEEVK